MDLKSLSNAGFGTRSQPLRRCCQNKLHSIKLHCFSNLNNNQGPIELPGGALWWLDINSNPNNELDTNPSERRSDTNSSCLSLVHSRQNTSLAPLSGTVVIDTEYELMGDYYDENSPPSSSTPCYGLVHIQSATTTSRSMVPFHGIDEDTNKEMMSAAAVRSTPTESHDKTHPRRTHRLIFTCNLCHTKNSKKVNPLAWQKGSVFARCDGCSVVHKLKDNLKIFHELNGPVFPPLHLRSSFLVKESLERIEQARKMNEMKFKLDSDDTY